jgi:hypothetical protein
VEAQHQPPAQWPFFGPPLSKIGYPPSSSGSLFFSNWQFWTSISEHVFHLTEDGNSRGRATLRDGHIAVGDVVKCDIGFGRDVGELEPPHWPSPQMMVNY